MVKVLGFEFEGRRFSSPSTIASEVTGTHRTAQPALHSLHGLHWFSLLVTNRGGKWKIRGK